jgi:hypothetical protein
MSTKLKLWSVDVVIEMVVLASDRHDAERTALHNFEDCTDGAGTGGASEIRDVQHLPEEWDQAIPFCEESGDYPEEGLTCQQLFDLWEQQEREAREKAEQERRQMKLFPTE